MSGRCAVSEPRAGWADDMAKAEAAGNQSAIDYLNAEKAEAEPPHVNGDAPPLDDPAYEADAARFGSAVPDPHIETGTETETPAPDNNKPLPLPPPLWMGTIIDEPEPETAWLLDGILPVGGMGMVSAAPKVGKTTLARCLAFAVSRGAEFMGRETAKGRVLYVSLEDSRRMVRSHLAGIGANSGDPIGWYFSGDFPARTGARLNALEAVIRKFCPVLVVLDPLFKFISVSDGDAYSEVSGALDPLMQIARRRDTCILLAHHNRKGGGDTGEAVLGSTALFAGVDTLISLKRDGEARTIETIQRLGDDLPPTVLRMDATGWIDTAGVRTEVKKRELDEQILAVIGQAGESLDATEIAERSGRRKKAILDGLQRLTKNGALKQEGEGKRNDPYRFAIRFPN